MLHDTIGNLFLNINTPLGHIYSGLEMKRIGRNQTVKLARKWLNANISCWLTEAKGFPNVLFCLPVTIHSFINEYRHTSTRIYLSLKVKRVGRNQMLMLARKWLNPTLATEYFYVQAAVWIWCMTLSLSLSLSPLVYPVTTGVFSFS